MNKFYLLLLSITIVLFSCKTASKSYQKGNYKDAIELSIKELQKDPSNAEALNVLKDAYQLQVNIHEQTIRDLSNKRSDDRYAAIYNEYQQLQNLYLTVSKLPAVSRQLNAVNYSEYLETYRQKAADVHVANAEKWEEENTKAGYKQAYNEYKKALRYTSDVEVKKRRDYAYDAALTKVLVIPIQQDFGRYGGYDYRSSYQLQNFQNDVMRTLSFNMGSEFVKFFNERELRSKNLEPDEIMELNLGRIVLGRPFDDRSSREVSKKVVVKETVYKPDSVVKEYATVRGKITTVRRTVVSEGDLYITVRDPKGRIIWNDRFTGQHRWKTEFATFTGDERALSDSDKALLNQRSSEYPPSEDQIIDYLFREINNELSYRLRNYFARY